jgi:hypothetical protein
VAKRKLGGRVSGNPAKRAESRYLVRLAPEQMRLATDLWPVAYDYFVQDGRIALFADTPIEDTHGTLFVDLHGTIRIPLRDLEIPDGLTSFKLVASLRGQNDEVVLIASPAESFTRALAEVLRDVTVKFMNEAGASANVYMEQALEDRPILADQQASLQAMLPLIIHAGDTWPHEDD